jgi:hypothetical protein
MLMIIEADDRWITRTYPRRCGVLEAAAALSLIFFRVPVGVFLHLHGDKALIYIYYDALVVAVALGLMEVSADFWVSCDLNGRRGVEIVILWLYILHVIVIATFRFFFSAPQNRRCLRYTK